MVSKFAITGMGRSGTMWLAKVLNTSPTWEVEHEETISEPWGSRRVDMLLAAEDRNFGIVNSYLRWNFTAIKLARYRGVIVRDPMEIHASMVARGRPRLDHLIDSMYVLDGIIRGGVKPISFFRMVQDEDYLRRAIHWIEDFEYSRNPVNSSKSTGVVSEKDAHTICTRLSWFYREYAYLLSPSIQQYRLSPAQ